MLEPQVRCAARPPAWKRRRSGTHRFGEVAERLNAPVLKTGNGKPFASSNLALSANTKSVGSTRSPTAILDARRTPAGRGPGKARVNPTLSAKIFSVARRQTRFRYVPVADGRDGQLCSKQFVASHE